MPVFHSSLDGQMSTQDHHGSKVELAVVFCFLELKLNIKPLEQSKQVEKTLSKYAVVRRCFWLTLCPPFIQHPCYISIHPQGWEPRRPLKPQTAGAWSFPLAFFIQNTFKLNVSSVQITHSNSKTYTSVCAELFIETKKRTNVQSSVIVYNNGDFNTLTEVFYPRSSNYVCQ